MSDPFSLRPQGDSSTVKLTFLDPLGRAISGLKYQVSEGDNIFIRGVSNANGEARPFTTRIGASLAVSVQRFTSEEMKQIKTLIPSLEIFSVKLLSGKIKETLTLETATGVPGSYRRKTQRVEAGETLIKNSKKSEVPTNELAKTNNLNEGALLQHGQVIKTRTDDGLSDNDAERGRVIDSKRLANPAVSGSPVAVADGPTQADSGIPASTQVSKDRGINGTPKTAILMICEKNACLRIGATGLLVEEINIRLTGFGGSVKTDAPIDRFTSDTEFAVKKFQRDYMGVADTGQVCGRFLEALDEFMIKFPVSIESMRCQCRQCTGFGQKLLNSGAVKIYNNEGKPIEGEEYPGMHRGLIWLFRAALFYTSIKNKSLGYTFLKITSGYRCWYDNKKNNRKTYNHMGNALDIQFSKGNTNTRCTGSELEMLRKLIFMEQLGAKMQWNEKHRASLEAARDGATSWVHVDVRMFSARYKQGRYYAITQAALDGELLMNIVRKEGLFAPQNCGGIPRR